MGLYPGSVDSGTPATTYGPLPTHGFDSVALVYHTTETKGMPGFNKGNTAPHYVYAPLTGEWTMFAEYGDGYVGTMKGHRVGHYNCRAMQVEILGYSDSSHSPWVGDFTDGNYQDLADFYGWAADRYPIGSMVTPTPPGGWKYGVNSPYRLTDTEWAEFTGLTAHGAVPNQTHWDTGVLDLERIRNLAMGGDAMCPWDSEKCVSHYWPDTEMPKGVGSGEHQGMCRVPTEQQEACDWAFSSGRFKAGNTYRYHYDTPLTEGREMVFEYRDAN